MCGKFRGKKMGAYRHQDPGLQKKGKAKTAERRQGKMGGGW